MKHMDAVNVLRATKQTVKLKVLRRPAGVSCVEQMLKLMCSLSGVYFLLRYIPLF